MNGVVSIMHRYKTLQKIFKNIITGIYTKWEAATWVLGTACGPGHQNRAWNRTAFVEVIEFEA